jgi:putative RNA 2'-phosphotransferase
MNDHELNSLGRILAGILRHFPEKFKLEMDDKGWVVINTLIQAVRRRVSQFHWLRPHHILALVETDPKGRYEIQDNVIRATYGHSLDVDLDLPTDGIPEKLYYPTTNEEVELLMETGLKPSDRKMVHLSKSAEDAENAGKFRVPNPIILEIDAKSSIESGNIIKHAGTTVFTTSEILPEYIRVLAKQTLSSEVTPSGGARKTKKSAKAKDLPVESDEAAEDAEASTPEEKPDDSENTDTETEPPQDAEEPEPEEMLKAEDA